MMNSCVRSPRVTDQSIGSGATEQSEEEDIMQTTAAIPPQLPCVAAAPTTVEGVGGEARITTVDMVPTFR